MKGEVIRNFVFQEEVFLRQKKMEMNGLDRTRRQLHFKGKSPNHIITHFNTVFLRIVSTLDQFPPLNSFRSKNSVY